MNIAAEEAISAFETRKETASATATVFKFKIHIGGIAVTGSKRSSHHPIQNNREQLSTLQVI